MSRAFEFVVVVALAMILVGCGDKSGDEASSEVSSNDSGSDIEGSVSEPDSEYSDSDSSGEGVVTEPPDSDSSGEGIVTEPPDTDSSGEGIVTEPPDSDYSGEGVVTEPPDTDYSGEGVVTEPPDSDYSGEGVVTEPPDTDYSGEGIVTEPPDTDYSGTESDPTYSGTYNGTSGQPEKRAPKTYSEHARRAFEQGNDELALKYTYAAILTDAEAAKNQKLHYWAGPKKPTMAIRWGVGIDFRAQKNLKSRPPMIGDKPDIPDRDKRQPRVIGRKKKDDNNDDSGYDDSTYDTSTDEYGDGSGNGGTFRLPDDPWGKLVYLTGDVGERFLERLDMRRTRSYYGAVLKNAPTSTRKRSRNFSGDGDAAYADTGTTDSYDPSTDTAYYADDGTGGGGGRGQTGAQLIPGVTMLGLGNFKELEQRAKQRHLDVLLVFDVMHTTLHPRSKIEKCELGMHLILVSSGSELCKSRPINNIGVWNDRQNLQNEKNDPVDLAIDEILREFADEHVRVSDLPTLDAEMAKARVATLTDKGELSEPLPVLAEIKYYHTKGLLTDAELADAYKQVIGDAGLQLASTSLEEQKKALAPYLEAAATRAKTSPSRGTGIGTGGFR